MRLKTLAVSGLALLALAGGAATLTGKVSRADLADAGSWVLGLTAGAYPAGAKKPDGDKAARAVRVVLPTVAPLTTTLTLSGRTAPAEQAMISSRASGIVSERLVDIGDRVEAGALLARIEAPEIAQELLRARAAVGQIEARLTLATLDLERAESLVAKGHVSMQTKDERYAAKLTADADLNAARAEVKRLENIVSFQDVRAPFAGTIVERAVERGNKVVANQAQQEGYLFRIARMTELRIEIDVPQSQALKVSRGAPAKVTFSELPRETFSANVARTAGLIEQSSGTMRIELLMKNPELRIPAGLNGEVVIEIREDGHTVLVPNNTILTRNGRQVVAVVDGDNRVRIKPIVVARDLGERVAVSSGLDSGDRVIVSPNALLKEGDLVEIHSVKDPNASS